MQTSVYKIISWNVNGLRARMFSDVIPLLDRERPDFLFLQEIKGDEREFPLLFLNDLGYTAYWHSAKRPGYSGVATFAKQSPAKVNYGIGFPWIDDEGRVLTLEFNGMALINAYFPHSHRLLTRLPQKLDFLERLSLYIEEIRKSGLKVILGGDFNIAHQEMDLRNASQNHDNAGFRPEERVWIDRLIDGGMLDSFRIFCGEPGNYTWWSYRKGVRERNVGWRLDYFFIDGNLRENIISASILSDVNGSDHCPVAIELSF